MADLSARTGRIIRERERWDSSKRTLGELLDLYKMGHNPVNRQESHFPRVIRKETRFRLRHRELFLTRNARAYRTFCRNSLNISELVNRQTSPAR